MYQENDVVPSGLTLIPAQAVPPFVLVTATMPRGSAPSSPEPVSVAMLPRAHGLQEEVSFAAGGVPPEGPFAPSPTAGRAAATMTAKVATAKTAGFLLT